jgi:hypothetical protein
VDEADEQPTRAVARPVMERRHLRLVKAPIDEDAAML